MPHKQQHAKRQEHVKAFEVRDFFRDVLRSFVPSAYARLAVQPASGAALYLAGVAFLVTLLLTPLVYIGLARRLAVNRAYMEQALPDELYFEGRAADYEGEQPYTHVETAGDKQDAVIIDTTGGTTEIAAAYSSGLLITRDRIIQRAWNAAGESETFDSPIPETDGRIRAKAFFLNAAERQRWPRFALGVGTLFFWVAIPLFVLAALVSAISAIFEATRKGRRVPFGACFAVAAHAATPVAFFAASSFAARTFLQLYLLAGIPLLAFMILVTLGMQAYRRSFEPRPEARKAGRAQ